MIIRTIIMVTIHRIHMGKNIMIALKIIKRIKRIINNVKQLNKVKNFSCVK